MPRTRTCLLAASALGAAALASPAGAQTYAQQCDALIGAWSACNESGGSCDAQYSAVEQDCKCHTFRRGEWVLVEAAVADDNVCGSPPDDLLIPPPPEPTHEFVERPGGGGGGGGDDRKVGDPAPGDPSRAGDNGVEQDRASAAHRSD